MPRLWSWLAAAAVVAATPRPASQVHLALTNAVQHCPNGVAVSFASASPSPYHVQYQVVGSSQTWLVKTRPSDAYTVAHGRYQYQSPHLHTAYLCHLAPHTTYAYSIVDGGKASTFLTPPAPDAPDVSTVLSVVGDPGDTTESSATLEMLAAPFRGLRPHALVIAGDYAYANGQHEVWDRWFAVQEGVLGAVPSLGIPGNHETIVGDGHAAPRPMAWDMAGEDYLGYLKRVVTPLSADAVAHKRTYYSTNVGLVHMVFIDDYVGSRGAAVNTVGSQDWFNERSRMLVWLVEDLRRVNRTVTPWVLVFKHNPYYNTWHDHQCQCSPVKFDIADADRDNCWRGRYHAGSAMHEPHCGLHAQLEPILTDFGVDAVFAGHVHGYERTAPVAANRVDAARGAVYVTTGAGGNYEGHAGPRIPGPVPAWSLAVNNRVYGASKVVATRTSLEILWFANSDHETPQDAVTLPVRTPLPPSSPAMRPT